jgi:leader peptidase (prepilin peptidase)/N-methyltransferase
MMVEIITVIAGLSVGSFLNVVIARVPENISIINPPSQCPVCNKKIKPYDNIPIVSYLFLKGKCRFCKNPISVQYPLVELITAVFFLATYLKFGLSTRYFLSLFLVSILIPIFFIDLKHLVIPDKIIYPSLLVIAVVIIIMEATGQNSLPVIGNKGIMFSLYGFFLGGGFLYLLALISPLIFKKEGMGGGDIKLISFLGLCFGLYIFLILFISFLLGALFGIFKILKDKKSKMDEIPFGPFITTGAVATLFAGEKVFNLYLKFIGY